MRLSFAATPQDRLIHCDIGCDTALAAPVFCFSLLAPFRVVAGGRLSRLEGSYGEVLLPDLRAGHRHRVTLAYTGPGHGTLNRAWLPLGAYLRHAEGCTALPPLPAGRLHAEPLHAEPLHAEPQTDTLPVGRLRLVPPPDDWRPSGAHVSLSGVTSSHEALACADALARRNKLAPLLSPGGLPATVKTDSSLPADTYHLRISREGIEIRASGRGGVFYAAISLVMLINTHAARLPCGEIRDRPRFAWRGQHLDCARHFFRPASILRLLDLMALLKLNRFHWHFADDEAFRLELESLPELAARTAFRGEGALMPGLFGGGIRAGGSYSRADIRAIITHGAALNIAVMPEIEVTAHALAMTRVYPGMRDADDSGGEVSVQGYRKNTVNPAMAGTWRVLEAMIDEVAALFDFPVLHLGCDELPAGTWAGSPAVARLKARHRLAESRDVQGWMMARLARHAARRGKRAAAWEEAAQGMAGGIGNGALLFGWSGQAAGLAAARAGYEVVMCPAQHCYFDMAHSNAPGDWGANWAGTLPLSATVDWSPVPDTASDTAARIIGVHGAFWSEFTTDDAQLWPMLLPRIMGLSCKAWERAERVDAPLIQALASACQPIITAFVKDAPPAHAPFHHP